MGTFKPSIDNPSINNLPDLKVKTSKEEILEYSIFFFKTVWKKYFPRSNTINFRLKEVRFKEVFRLSKNEEID